MKMPILLIPILLSSILATAQPQQTPIDSLYLVTISLGNAWDHSKKAQEQTYFKEHSEHLKSLREAGKIKLGARYTDKGMLVVTAPSIQAAKDMIQSDPSMINHLFAADVQKLSVFYYGSVEKPFIKPAKIESPWKPVEYFIGDWKGTGEGESGKGEYERSYKWSLNKNFIEVNNKSTYSPQEKNPKGEVHEDVGYISFDKTEQKLVLRQFHVEGFVNQYKTENPLDASGPLVFVSYAIENIPVGWRARETYQMVSANEFTETFELAPPGKDFFVYSKVVLHRVR